LVIRDRGFELAVVTSGTVQMRGEPGPGAHVEVQAEGTRLRLLSGADVVGEWDIGSIGIQSLNDGFAVRAEGEEFVLRTDDDAGIAREIGIATASPRLARSMAAAQDAEASAGSSGLEAKSGIGSIVFALAGVLVLSGGFFLRETRHSARRIGPRSRASRQVADSGSPSSSVA